MINISLQRQSKWSQRHKPVVHLFEEQAEKTREQNDLFWDNLALPKKSGRRQQKHRKGKAPTTQIEAYKQVDERDGRSCQFPGCWSMNINHHHVQFKSQGGKNDAANIITLCLHHHSLGKESPHQSIAWRRYWEGHMENLYPAYWQKIRENNRITATQQEVAK